MVFGGLPAYERLVDGTSVKVPVEKPKQLRKLRISFWASFQGVTQRPRDHPRPKSVLISFFCVVSCTIVLTLFLLSPIVISFMDFSEWLGNFAEAVSAANPVHIPQTSRDQQSGIIARVAEAANDPEEVNRLLNSLAVEDSPAASRSSDTDDELDVAERVLRRFRRRSGRISERRQRDIQSDRERRRRGNAHSFGNTFHLSSLFDGSDWGGERTGETTDEESDARYSVGLRRVRRVSDPTTNDPPEEEGAVGYNVGAQLEFWDDILPGNIVRDSSSSLNSGRSFLGQTIVEARANVKRALLVATLEIKRDNPGRPAEFAWMLLTDRLVREEVVQWYSGVAQTWYFAFGQPARLHFLSIYNAESAVIEALWDTL